MKVTLKDIMKLPVFKDSRIIAGNEGIEKEIKSVTVAEVPDAADWLKGGELVVTTGYFLKDDPRQQKDWFKSLIVGDATALAIKPERFLGKIPSNMIEIADENSFPLIRLPYRIDWPQIIESVMNTINENQSEIIRRSEEIHDRLTEIVLREDGIEDIADTLARLVDNLIVVEDIEMENLAVGIPGSSEDERLKEILNYRLSKKFKDKFKESKYYKNKLKNCNNRADNIDHRKCNNGAYTLELEYREEKVTQLTIPIIANHVTYGFISLIEHHEEANEVDIVALEHGATTIALDMTKKKAVYETKKRLKKDFLNDLLEGRLNNNLILEGKYNFIDYDVRKSTVAIILKLEKANLTEDASENNYSIVQQDKYLNEIIAEEFNGEGQNYFVYNEGSRVTILLQFNQKRDESEVYEKVNTKCKSIGEKLLKHSDNALYYFGIGGFYSNSKKTKRSYQEAKDALRIGKLFIGENQAFVYKELGIYRILSMISNEGEVVEFCNDTLGKLIKYDKENKENLCYNLKKFLMNNGNISQAAKELYIHPNTLSYRIKKIGKILDKDLDDPRVRFNLFLALMIKNLYLNE